MAENIRYPEAFYDKVNELMQASELNVAEIVGVLELLKHEAIAQAHAAAAQETKNITPEAN
jgi:hypothetical protein